MCLASIYSQNNGKKALLMERVAGVEMLRDGIVCRDFLGRERRFDVSVAYLDLENNAIICRDEKEKITKES